MTKNLFLLLLNAVIIYLLLNIFVRIFAGSLLYLPPRAGYSDDENILKLKVTETKKSISARYFPHPKAKYTILISHGNAEDIGYMLPFFRQMHQAGFAVFAYDYPGYGTSNGAPNEKNCYAAAHTVYLYLTQTLKIPPQQIILYGRSLGAAMALDLAIRTQQQPAAAVILQSPFLTAYRVITHFPLFIFDQFNNLRKIKKLTIPLLIIHGSNDNVVPEWHGMKLYQAAQSPKQYVSIKNAGHIDIYLITQEKYWHIITNFVKTMLSE